MITSTSNDITGGMTFPKPTKKFTLDYAKGTSVETKGEQGLILMARLFGKALNGVLCVVRGEFGQAVGEFMGITDDMLEKKEPDVKGLITAVVDLGKAIADNEVAPPLKVDIVQLQDLIKNINRASVKDLIHKLTLRGPVFLTAEDFGRR